ncbi:class I SAM-dependent methyltransferase [Anaerocolumna xylanovorans]|uniref:Ubiquinone/menaquinone biosynthesis C-methylase UbiE n=1 Tax=Anaerocolumna xylanovorans DSM 12503 TaxID=1121345 RepID=A0A1M7XWD0_9FIRM|nr:class I SAM-dependent methyltransferase [Anaerocolumna xylanovorans]SHO43073.1 Ubiquinone/menaquinone biosynthesis C-methylase UbiE [Anaerocolumna xylanovorans DSM 12503]
MNYQERTVTKTKKHFEESAEYYDESFDGKFVKPMYEHILRRLRKEECASILDVGCGTGNVLIELANGSRKLYGVDLSENMVNIAKERLKDSAVIVTADAGELPFENNSFDILLCNASFHHYPQPEAVLGEMRRVLKPSGVLLIGEGYAYQPFRMFLNIYFRFSGGGDYRSYGINELKKLCKRAGFDEITIERKGMRIFLEAKTVK